MHSHRISHIETEYNAFSYDLSKIKFFFFQIIMNPNYDFKNSFMKSA